MVKLHPRTALVNRVRNEIERSILDHPEVPQLTCVELAFILSELAFRYSTLALKSEREDDGEIRSHFQKGEMGIE